MEMRARDSAMRLRNSVLLHSSRFESLRTLQYVEIVDSRRVGDCLNALKTEPNRTEQLQLFLPFLFFLYTKLNSSVLNDCTSTLRAMK